LFFYGVAVVYEKKSIDGRGWGAKDWLQLLCISFYSNAENRYIETASAFSRPATVRGGVVLVLFRFVFVVYFHNLTSKHNKSVWLTWIEAAVCKCCTQLIGQLKFDLSGCACRYMCCGGICWVLASRQAAGSPLQQPPLHFVQSETGWVWRLATVVSLFSLPLHGTFQSAEDLESRSSSTCDWDWVRGDVHARGALSVNSMTGVHPSCFSSLD